MTAAAALLLFPGAGSDRTQPSLVAIEEAVAPLPTVRADFPYRTAGRRAPDRAPILLAAVVEEAAAIAATVTCQPEAVVLGGRSMGGRMCSMAVADGLGAAGLVLISYPLHPPGKPEKLRVEHLPQIHVPCLFIHGTKDPFGSPAELTEWTATIPGDVTHVWVEGRGHDLKGADELIASTVSEWVQTLARR
jgi:uncharacterized protein